MISERESVIRRCDEYIMDKIGEYIMDKPIRFKGKII